MATRRAQPSFLPHLNIKSENDYTKRGALSPPIPTPLGPCRLLASSTGLQRLFWEEAQPLPPVPVDPYHPILQHWTTLLQRFFQGFCPFFDGPLDLSFLSPFTRQVYALARTIPYGQTWTYGQLAQVLGRPKAARAVGQALARNPLPIIIPCHRVVNAQGRLHGFSAPGGLQTKAWLLQWERQSCPGQSHCRFPQIPNPGGQQL